MDISWWITQSGTSHPITPVTGLPPAVTLKRSKAGAHVPVYLFFSKTGWTLPYPWSEEVQTVGSTKGAGRTYVLLLCPSISQKCFGFFFFFFFTASCHPWKLHLEVHPSLQSLKVHLSNWEPESISNILLSPSDGWEREKTSLLIIQCLFDSPCWPTLTICNIKKYLYSFLYQST